MQVPFFSLDGVHKELGTELDEAYRRVMASGWFILGPEVEAFEREFAEYCGAAHCVTVGNGLDALQLTLRAMNIGEGDEVILPSHTFIATWLAVAAVGATPQPVEVTPSTFNLDPQLVEDAITPRTRAILAVHLYGLPADTESLGEIARRRGIQLLEDAAQAHGARRHGVRAGSLGTAAGFSFYPTKNLGAAGDGGGVTTSDADLAKRIRLLRNYGSATKYQHEIVGVNSRLDELQAAFLRVKLRRLDEWNQRRRSIAAGYAVGLADLPGLQLPESDAAAEHVYHLYVVRHPHRDSLADHLRHHGIGTLVHYPVPVHRSGAFSAMSKPTVLPLADVLSREVLSLPMGPHMTPMEQERVVDAVRSFCLAR